MIRNVNPAEGSLCPLCHPSEMWKYVSLAPPSKSQCILPKLSLMILAPQTENLTNTLVVFLSQMINNLLPFYDTLKWDATSLCPIEGQASQRFAVALQALWQVCCAFNMVWNSSSKTFPSTEIEAIGEGWGGGNGITCWLSFCHAIVCIFVYKEWLPIPLFFSTGPMPNTFTIVLSLFFSPNKRP